MLRENDTLNEKEREHDTICRVVPIGWRLAKMSTENCFTPKVSLSQYQGVSPWDQLLGSLGCQAGGVLMGLHPHWMNSNGADAQSMYASMQSPAAQQASHLRELSQRLLQNSQWNLSLEAQQLSNSSSLEHRFSKRVPSSVLMITSKWAGPVRLSSQHLANLALMKTLPACSEAMPSSSAPNLMFST